MYGVLWSIVPTKSYDAVVVFLYLHHMNVQYSSQFIKCFYLFVLFCFLYCHFHFMAQGYKNNGQETKVK